MTNSNDLIDRLVDDWRRERPSGNPDSMQVVGRIIRLGRRYENLVTQFLKPHSIAYSDFDVLATLRRSGEPYRMTPTELQKSVLLTSGAMTACLRRLESAGFLLRETTSHDRRQLSAKLTANGYDIVETLIDYRFQLARDALMNLDNEEIVAAETLLRKLEME